MRLSTLGALVSFTVQILAGVATVIWPDQKIVAWAIFAFASITLIVSIAWWLFANYRFVWPLARRDESKQNFFKFPNPYTPILVRGEYFQNESVQVDGRRFFECKFENVTFVYSGLTPIQFENCDVVGTRVIKSEKNDSVDGALILAYALGYFNDNFNRRTDWKTLLQGRQAMSAQTLREALKSDAAFTKWWLDDVPGEAESACSYMRADILALIEEERNPQINGHPQSEIDQERLDKFVCAALAGCYSGVGAVNEARVALKALGEG